MGRSTTPTFVVDYQDQLGLHRAAWSTKTSGRPTDTNLEAWRVAMNKSMNPGGCNEHVSKEVGFILHVSKASIHNQKTGRLHVADAKAPMFEVLG